MFHDYLAEVRTLYCSARQEEAQKRRKYKAVVHTYGMPNCTHKPNIAVAYRKYRNCFALLIYASLIFFAHRAAGIIIGYIFFMTLVMTSFSSRQAG